MSEQDKKTDPEIEVEIEEKKEAEGDGGGLEVKADVDKTEGTGEQTDAEALRAQVEEFKRGQETERTARIAAEQRLNDVQKQTTAKVADAQLDAINNAIGLVDAEINQATSRYTAAMEAGDYTAAAKAQREIARSETRLVSLEDGKQALEEQKKNPGRGQSADPTDSYISQFSPRSQDYLRRNQSFVTDPRLNKKMIAAHYEAEAEGFVADTDAYFDFIDKRMGGGEADERPRAPEHKRAAPAAPVSRSSQAANGDLSGRKTVKLTRGEVETAEALGITPAEYARRKLKMAEQGLYDRNN